MSRSPLTITADEARKLLNANTTPAVLDPDAAIVVTTWTLHNTEPGHNKFYTVMVSEEGHLLLNWGRIGADGQFKTEKYGSYSDAETIALRQVYAKAPRGYRMQEEKFAFTAARGQFDSAINVNDGTALIRTRNMARNGSAFVTQQQTASKHYDAFIEQAKELMERAMTQSFVEVFDDWQSLQEAWAELDHKHSTAQITIELTSAMLQAQLAAS